MARVGNEAKLILKLTMERAHIAQTRMRAEGSNKTDTYDKAFAFGKADGVGECLLLHEGVIEELERS